MSKPPDPSLLQTFVAIVDSGSFTLAAKRVHRTQSAVSMQIRRLEQILGYELFDRLGHNIRLTAHGETFYDHARRILMDYRLAMGALDQPGIEGDLTVGAPEDYVLTFFPRILRSFHQLYPNIRIHIVSESSRQLADRLSIGAIDLALLTEGESAIGGTVIAHHPLVWVESGSFPVHEQEPLPLAIFHSGDVFRRFAVHTLTDAGRTVAVTTTSSGSTGIYAAIYAGVAVGVLFEANVGPGMRVLGPDDGFPTLPKIGIVLQRHDDQCSEAVSAFCEHVHRAVSRPDGTTSY